jgi:hypothetical protein
MYLILGLVPYLRLSATQVNVSCTLSCYRSLENPVTTIKESGYGLQQSSYDRVQAHLTTSKIENNLQSMTLGTMKSKKHAIKQSRRKMDMHLIKYF